MKSKLYFSAMPYTRTAGQLVKAVGSLKLSSEKCLRFNLLPNWLGEETEIASVLADDLVYLYYQY